MRGVVLGAAAAAAGAAALYAAGPMTAGAFSRQMGAHLLLSYAAAPLLVLVLRPAPPAPLPAFLALNAVTFGLHVPAVHHALMAPWGLAAQGALFLASGALFWAAAARGGLGAVILLLAQMAACALLGAAVTFSRGVYSVAAPADTALGGVLMWVVGGAVVMAAALHHLIALLSARPLPGVQP